MRWKLLIPTSTLMTVFATAAGAPRLRFPSPIEVAVSPDGARLYVLCEGTDEVAVYDTAAARDRAADRGGPRSERALARAGRQAVVRGELVERHGLRDRHRVADGPPHAAGRVSSRTPRYRTATDVSCTSRTGSATIFPSWTSPPGRK